MKYPPKERKYDPKGEVKLVREDGKVYRMRRGKLVEIPPKWVGRVTSRQTINKRQSKGLKKEQASRKGRGPMKKSPHTWAPRHAGSRRKEEDQC